MAENIPHEKIKLGQSMLQLWSSEQAEMPKSENADNNDDNFFPYFTATLCKL